jgi:dTDP-4-amino-4,6-dideoxygalactose transaminase
VLLCRTPEYAAKAAGIINCGRSHDPENMKETGDNYTFGANYRMSELACALAAIGIERFPEQAQQREEMIGYMEESLSEITGIRLLRRDPRHTTRSFYHFIFAIDPAVFGAEHEEVCFALQGEGIPSHTGYEAMHNYTLFNPGLSKLAVPSAFPEYFDFEKMEYPEATRACEREAVVLDEQVFRAGHQGVDDAIAALKKVQRNAPALREVAENFKVETE